MSVDFVAVFILATLLIVGIRIVMSSFARSSQDVLVDLRDQKLELYDPILDYKEISAKKINKNNVSAINISGFIFNDDLARAGLISSVSRRNFEIVHRILPILGGILFLMPSLFGVISASSTTFVLVSIGFAAGVIFRRHLLRAKKERYLKSLTFFLPMVMERVVMAVQAGLDIVPAINTAITVTNDPAIKDKEDPLSVLLKIASKLTESGLSFERALKELASVVESSAVRHAFLHLAVAQKEGGVLVMPLRELSDSTQIHYQESIESEIAEMPVKATMPLLCTFAGLLLCFLTPPFLQVLNILTENMPGK